MIPKKVSIIIRGYVQGVGFRYFACDRAESLGLVGEVRNLPDGGVEVVAEGDEQILKDYVSILKKGPHGARVTGVQESWSDPVAEFKKFAIKF